MKEAQRQNKQMTTDKIHVTGKSVHACVAIQSLRDPADTTENLKSTKLREKLVVK